MREPFGMVILPLIMLFMSHSNMILGYASTPIDPAWAWRHPRRAALMSAGGPMANLLLAGIGFAVLCATGTVAAMHGEPVAKMAFTFLMLNVLLFVFNLFPIPPLDGAGIVEGLLPASRGIYDSLRRSPSAAMIGILGVAWVMNRINLPILETVVGWLPR
jgi:Zn-dependent protease